MAAYLLALVNIKNPEKWKQYVESVPATLAPFGGKLLMRGAAAQGHGNEAKFKNMALLEFTDQPSIVSWHDSVAYQELISGRNEGAEVRLVSYEARG